MSVYRGQLIFSLQAFVARRDQAATDAAGKYDDDFREIRKYDTDGDGIGERAPVEKAEVQFPAQIENDASKLQRMSPSGDLPRSAIGLVVHSADMEALGLYSAGDFDFRRGDRLLRIENQDGSVWQSFARVPVYLTHVQRLNGYLGNFGNLAAFIFGDRQQGMS